jgi:hypothetical protein
VTLEEWRTIFSAGTVVSVTFAALNYWLARKKSKIESDLNKDKEICAQAIIALERSFKALTSGSEDPIVPKASRLNWLASARLIETFKKLKSELNTDLYKLVCSQHEEHWSHQFYLCLKDSVFQNQSYFQLKTQGLTKANIEPRSALIIFNFKQWQPDRKDPLAEIKIEDYINDGYTLNGEMGLEYYIDSLRSN